MAKIGRKEIHSLLFHEFFKASLLWFRIVSVSGHTHFISNFCQTVENISRISQFHDFFQSDSWRILAIWPNCVPVPRDAAFFFFFFYSQGSGDISQRRTNAAAALCAAAGRTLSASSAHSTTTQSLPVSANFQCCCLGSPFVNPVKVWNFVDCT